MIQPDIDGSLTMRTDFLFLRRGGGIMGVTTSGSQEPRKRKANKKTTRAAAGQAFQFLPHEFKILKHNKPGPSGLLGGFQGMENILIAYTNETTLACVLNAEHFERLTRYIKNYGDGGPNGRLRRACIPALRRVGIDLLPEWRAPS